MGLLMRHFHCAALAAVAVVGFASVATAADVPAKGVWSTKVPAAALEVNWTGFYVGGDLGGLWSSNTGAWAPLPSPAVFGVFGQSGSNGGSSFIGGLHAGYNWQFAPTWVAGIEGDWSWIKASGSFSQIWAFDPPPGTLTGSFTNMSSSLDWVASLRARLGYLFFHNLLAYGTGGVAWTKIDYAANNSSGFVGLGSYITNAAVSSTQTGYTVGGGLEWAITNNWLLRGEYLYYHFNSGPSVVAQSINFPTFPSSYSWSSTNVSVARVGMSYKF
jgi:outer membrane immunogenic protein